MTTDNGKTIESSDPIRLMLAYLCIAGKGGEP